MIPPYYAIIKENVIDDYEYISLDYSSYTTGSTYKYDFTGEEQVFVAPVTGYYQLQTWGAQGGSYNETYHGGYGAYSKGVVYLEEGEILYINVGGKGGIANNGTAEGGYNGGGSATTESDDNYAGSGGGATHIATSSGLLNS